MKVEKKADLKAAHLVETKEMRSVGRKVDKKVWQRVEKRVMR